jgi:hypothetical protein
VRGTHWFAVATVVYLIRFVEQNYTKCCRLRFRFLTLCSISWEYNSVGEIGLEDYENTRPPRRSHFEMVLPRKVRQDMLRRDWDVKQTEIAESVRRNVKVKNQRKATVNNLNKATKMEEVMESAARKMKRLLTLQKPVSAQVRDLEAQLDLAERMRNKMRAQLRMSRSLDERQEVPEAIDTSTSS